jgi:low affinity Fe/Cu permease
MAITVPEEPIHPALVQYRQERARSVQNRVADSITTFAGSMWFVYIHVLWFAIWIGLGVEAYPYGLLTIIVSLEAIFLATFVMITQNRQEDARRHLADQEWRMVQSEERQNEELLGLSKQNPRRHKGDPRAHEGICRDYRPGIDDRNTSALKSPGRAGSRPHGSVWCLRGPRPLLASYTLLCRCPRRWSFHRTPRSA